jgi:hypothetical protein
MKTYAVLTSDRIVENVIVAPSLEVAEGVTSKVCIYITEATKNAHIGLSWDGTEFEQPFVEPVEIVEVVD